MGEEWGMVQIAALRTGPNDKQFSGQLPGERVEIIDRNIGYLSPIGKISGRVLITRFRLRFEASDGVSVLYHTVFRSRKSISNTFYRFVSLTYP
ncbi:hypothetical protein GCK32_020219 [Trichostrongylus colubriformis]|uniref:Uncharacterized protein n=1 Tax=Trichostrongylus colubriformis TaxID=6319 RepID=A0AAN8FT57_TRICO